MRMAMVMRMAMAMRAPFRVPYAEKGLVWLYLWQRAAVPNSLVNS